MPDSTAVRALRTLVSASIPDEVVDVDAVEGAHAVALRLASHLARWGQLLEGGAK